MIPVIGATCLGIFMGWMVRYFVFRFTEFTPQVLGMTVSVLTGGAIVGFLSNDDNKSETVWFYPIGLLIGCILYSLFGLMARNREDPDRLKGIAYMTNVEVNETIVGVSEDSNTGENDII